MPIPNLYSIWVDPSFYIAVVIFITALILLIYSIKKYIEMENKVGLSMEGADGRISPVVGTDVMQMTKNAEHVVASAQPQVQDSPADAVRSEKTKHPAGVRDYEEVAQVPVQKQTLQEHHEQSESKAEIFLKGIHNNLLSLDERLKSIETTLAKDKSTVNFTIEYLEDLIEKMNEINKEGIKTRLKYLINNFLKH